MKTLLLALLAVAAPAATAFGQSAAADFTSATRYDAKRRVTGTIASDPDGAGPLRFAAVRNSYDPAGNLVRVEKGELAAWQPETVAPATWTDFTVHQAIDSAYDLMGRKLRESLSGRDPATGQMVVQTVTQTSYDPLGRIACVAIRMNPATFANLPGSACTPAAAHATFGPDRIIRNRYNVAGRLARVETGVGTSERRDLALYTYTANGKMASLTDARGYRAEMRHDGHDRQVRWVFPSKTVPGRTDEADYEEYGWDPAGNRISFRNRAGETLGYTYDALNRMTYKDVPETGGDVAYGYDLRGLQRSARYGATGPGIASAYDKAGRQISTTTDLDGTSRRYTLAWDANSNRTRLTHPDGPWFDYGHDGLDRMTTLKDSAGATLVTLAYDSAGNRDTATYANGVVTRWDFDPVGRLTSLAHDFGGSAATHDVTFSYAYNPASQIVSRTISNDLYVYIPASADTGYSVNGLNQYTQIGGGAVVHDSRGNLIQEGGRALSYDSENRLIGVVAAPQNFGLAYDPQGRFRAVTLTGFVAAFDMVGTDIVAARNNGGATTERYAFGPAVDEPMVGYDNAGARYYFHADGHGNVVAHSNAAGSATRTIGYDEYGRPSITNSRFLHAGKMHIGGVNAYNNNARFYDYNLGRFLQTDPIGYDDQINLYAYVGNDPINATDPTGLIEASSCAGDGHGNVSASCSGGNVLDAMIAYRTAISWGSAYLSSAAAQGTSGSIGGVETGDDEWEGVKSRAIEGLDNSPMHFARLGRLRGIGRLIGGVKQAPTVIWKYRTHSADRLRGAGISLAKVEQRVMSSLQRWPTSLRPGDHLRAQFKIDGKWVEWRAQVRPNGDVNVGTVFPLTR